ncbi:MAG: protein kinase [Zoogloeaceae bacterium]|nr:protein kinase [Zoogloeaceae bacterium]
MNPYVRICPVCDTENPVERTVCLRCSSLLSDVDFSLSPTRAGEPAPGTAPDKAPDKTQDETQGKALEIPAAISSAQTRTPSASGEGVRCPDPECGQMNPPESRRCRYCNTPLPAAVPSLSPPPSQTAAVSSFELAPPELAAAMPSPKPPAHLRVALPATLAERFRVTDELPAAGSEADLLIVEDLHSGDARVVKIYRRGIAPDKALLKKLATAGPHVVRIMEYGEEDGIAWEMMEYCRAGNLRALMQGAPMSRDRLLEITRELAAGLTEVHAVNILHRDLKPENVLLRCRSPLSLALTDFGIASLFEGTRLFTDSARTVKYAAPEALTGVLDAKADWWSLGMILLEAASGRHPFDGLSEQVINYHLATRPMAIEGVADERFALLCRGLLLRNPARRFGAAEVARWLAGDLSLSAPRESVAEVAHPYVLGKHMARNGEELALALAANWQEGARDLARGLVLNWLKAELHDFVLIRNLSDIMELRGEHDERRLLRFLLAAAPGMPPVWRGEPADRDALLRKARQAAAEEGKSSETARLWLESLFVEDALSLFSATDAELAALGQRWRQQIDIAQRAWEIAREQQHHWRSRLSPKSGEGHSEVNFDAAVFGWNAGIRFPKRSTWHGHVLLTLLEPEFRSAVRADVEQAAARFAESAPWFVGLIEKWQTPEVTLEEQDALLLVAWRLRESARESIQMEHNRRQDAQKKREKSIDAWRQAFMRLVGRFGALGDADGSEAREEWRHALEELYKLSEHLASARYTEESFLQLRRQISGMERLAFSLESALDALELRKEHLDIFLRLPRLFWVGGGILLFAALISVAYALPAALVGMVGFIAFHFRRHARARRDLSVQLQLFRRALSSLASGNPAPKAGAAKISDSPSGLSV